MKLYQEDLERAFVEVGFSGHREVLPGHESGGWTRLQLDRYLAYPRVIRRAVGPLDTLHVLDHSYGHLCSQVENSVVTCHDIAEYRFSGLRAHQLYLWKRRVESIRNARKVIAISENTKRDLLEVLGLDERQVVVNYYGHDRRFCPAEGNSATTLGAACVDDRIRPGSLVVLHVGSNILRKNIPTLLRSIDELRKQGLDVTLLKVGHPLMESVHRPLIDRLDIAEAIVDVGSKSLDELVDIYRVADVFVFPSTYEGFGRPVLEAQGCGCPVIAARSSSLVEVGGEGALYHEAENYSELAALIQQLSREGERARLRAAGLENVTRFSWRRHAKVLIEQCY